MFGGEPPHNINDHESQDAEGVLRIAADTLRTLGINNWCLAWHGRKDIMLLLGPEHAASVASSGWSRRKVREYLYEKIARRRDELQYNGMYGMRDWTAELNALPMDAKVPIAPSADDILVMVVGGDGKHSAALPSFGATVSVTREIR